MQPLSVRSLRLMAPLALVAFAGPAAAQSLSLAPQIGFYIPTEVVSQAATGGAFTELEGGLSFGARLGVRFGKRLGIHATGAYVPTTFKLAQGSQNVTSEDAKLFLGSGQVVFFLLPPSSFLSLFVNGGVGVVSRGGVAFTSQAKKTNVAGVFGAGAGVRLGGLSVNAGADLFSYSAAYQGSTQLTSETISQRDIQVKLGLGIPFGGR